MTTSPPAPGRSDVPPPTGPADPPSATTADSPTPAPPGYGEPLGRMMATDSHEELFRLLLEVAIESPLGVLADCVRLMTEVIAKRIHDETGEITIG